MSICHDTLLPCLRPLSHTTTNGLSDDGFSDSPAYIALSRQLSAGFTCGGRAVSYRGLGELDLSAHRAWDTAAANLLAQAHSTEGVRFLTRSAERFLGKGAPGLQVAIPGGPASAWLSHPQPFTILDRHVSGLLGERVGYLVPSQTILLALPLSELDDLKWAKQASARTLVGEQLLSSPVTWTHGFPVEAPAPMLTHP